jgi:calcineurin-like phosphoesterase family protein
MTVYTLEESKNVFLTADFHFGHNNIIKYCNRPFKTTEEMNETLLNNYKKVITDTSLVYFLGDMSFGRQVRKEQTPKWWCEQLTGTIVSYIKGSHDHGIRPSMASFPKNVQKVVLEDDIEVLGIKFHLQHEPYFHNGERSFDWLIHGHVHEAKPMWTSSSRNINVSVEATNYAPVLLYDIVNTILERDKLLKEIFG